MKSRYSFSSVGCFNLNGDTNDRLCQAPNLKVAYYKDNLPQNNNLPFDGLLSLVPYQTDLDFGDNTIRMDTTGGEVFTSGRSDNVATRFVGYAVFTGLGGGSYSVCLSRDNEGKLYIDGDLIVVTMHNLGRTCGTVQYTAEADSGVKRVEVEFTEEGGGARCIVEWKPPGSSTYNDLPFITSKMDDELDDQLDDDGCIIC